MKTTARSSALIALLLCAAAFFSVRAEAALHPLKVFILVGQSNMQGHADVKTFDYIGKDPKTAPLLREMLGPNGKPKVCEHVWISYISPDYGAKEKNGKLTTGFGANGECIGPEFTFGIYIEKLLGEPVLIIKTAWGGKSLNTDFRPPGAGPYEFNEAQLEKFKQKGKDIAAMKAEKEKATGVYYRLMIEHVRKVLSDPKKFCPDYDRARGFELAGFVWFQGWNDLVDGDTYPQQDQPGGYDAYGKVLAQLIRDVRRDLKAPRMPFLIGVMGVGGVKEGAKPQQSNFRNAQLAPILLPEFKGNVGAVQTAPFWADELAAIDEKRERITQMEYLLRVKDMNAPNKDGTMNEAQQKEYLKKFEADLISPADAALWKSSASNFGFHYLGCAKTFALMGKAFAEATLMMMKEQKY